MSKSLAIAYSMKKKASKGHQSSCTENCESPCTVHEKANMSVEHEGDVKRPNEMAIEEDDKDLNQDRVGRAMKKRYSKGGMIANEAKSNRDTDFLATDDDLEFNYTGKNSGDELSSPGEDDRRKDVVSKAMASRKKKDRLPNPR